MLKNLAKKLTNNLGLKVLAVLFAIALWIVVVNIDDPVKPAQYTILSLIHISEPTRH